MYLYFYTNISCLDSNINDHDPPGGIVQDIAWQARSRTFMTVARRSGDTLWKWMRYTFVCSPCLSQPHQAVHTKGSKCSHLPPSRVVGPLSNCVWRTLKCCTTLVAGSVASHDSHARFALHLGHQVIAPQSFRGQKMYGPLHNKRSMKRLLLLKVLGAPWEFDPSPAARSLW